MGGSGPLLDSDGDLKGPGLVILSTVPGEADRPGADAKGEPVSFTCPVQGFKTVSQSSGISIILDGHIVKVESISIGDDHGVVDCLLHGFVVDVQVRSVSQADGDVIVVFPNNISPLGDGDSGLSAGTVIGIVLPVGDTDVPSAFRDSGVGQPRDPSALQRSPVFSQTTDGTGFGGRIILDGHIVHGQIVRRGICYHFVPNGLPQLVIVYRAVGVVGQGHGAALIQLNLAGILRLLGQGDFIAAAVCNSDLIGAVAAIRQGGVREGCWDKYNLFFTGKTVHRPPGVIGQQAIFACAVILPLQTLGVYIVAGVDHQSIEQDILYLTLCRTAGDNRCAVLQLYLGLPALIHLYLGGLLLFLLGRKDVPEGPGGGRHRHGLEQHQGRQAARKALAESLFTHFPIKSSPNFVLASDSTTHKSPGKTF